MMDPREARFLASQAERLSSNKKQHSHVSAAPTGRSADEGVGVGSNDAPELIHDAVDYYSSSSSNNHGNAVGGGGGGGDDDGIIINGSKQQSHLFFKNFRSLCSEFQRQIDTLLFISPITTATTKTGKSNDDNSSSNNNNSSSSSSSSSNENNAKAYYATASKRNEGRCQLDSILRNVRLLQRHALSASSSSILQLSTPTTKSETQTVSSSSNANVNANANANNELQLLLQTKILSNPMPEVTQTDVRLLTQEIDLLLKRIDDARKIVCPKEKFVFVRYRKAMEQRELLGGVDADDMATNSYNNDLNASNTQQEQQEEDNPNHLRSKYGGVLENKTNCIIEISSNGTVVVRSSDDDDDEGMTEEQLKLQYCTAPRSIRALPYPAAAIVENQSTATTTETSSAAETASAASSYLLQNLHNTTLILHGSRPSLHIQNISHCKLYITQPTMGPVHVTNCTHSTIHCSAYQLRVHESKNVRFNVWVRSGPIIEDCTGMVFEGNYYSDEESSDVNESDTNASAMNGIADGVGGGGGRRNMYWDVKDFNWLRALRKSPNFVVIEKKHQQQQLEVVGRGGEGVDGIAQETCSVGNAADESSRVLMEVAEDDSEDEL